MHDFILRELKNIDTEQELKRIGFDNSYICKAVDKFNYKNLKIYSFHLLRERYLKYENVFFYFYY